MNGRIDANLSSTSATSISDSVSKVSYSASSRPACSRTWSRQVSRKVGKDDRAADGAGVRDILPVRAVEAALVAACGVDVGEEALVGVLVAEGPLPAAIVGHEGKQI